jgi:tryptophan halogenase
VRPAGYNPLVDLMGDKELRGMLGDIERVIGKCVDVMPTHKQFIEAVAKAGPPGTARR